MLGAMDGDAPGDGADGGAAGGGPSTEGGPGVDGGSGIVGIGVVGSVMVTAVRERKATSAAC